MARKSFIFYESFVKAVEELEDKDRLQFYDLIVKYAFDENNQEIPEINIYLKAMFRLVKPILDSDKAKYNNGCKGGRPQKVSNKRHNQTKPNHNQTKPNHNQTITTPEPALSNDVDVDLDLDVDVDVDLDEDVDGSGSNKLKPKSKSEIFRDICFEIDLPDGIDRGHWREWVNYRWMIKKPYKTLRGPEQGIRELIKVQSETGDSFTDIINYAIDKEWQTFYAIDKQNNNSKTVKEVIGDEKRYPGE